MLNSSYTYKENIKSAAHHIAVARDEYISSQKYAISCPLEIEESAKNRAEWSASVLKTAIVDFATLTGF